jgi:hypothetical protein
MATIGILGSVLCLITGWASAADSVPTLQIHPVTLELEVVSEGKTVALLPNGTIGRLIELPNQSFKVSYGKDLNQRWTAIVYPNGKQPSIEFFAFGEHVKLSGPGSVTIIAPQPGSPTQFIAGHIGSVSISGTALNPGDSWQLVPSPSEAVASTTGSKKPSRTATASTPVPRKTPALSTASIEPTPTQQTASAPYTVPGSLPENADTRDIVRREYKIVTAVQRYHQRVARTVDANEKQSGLVLSSKGRVETAPSANDTLRPLRIGEVLPPGSVVRTIGNGQAVIQAVPGALMTLDAGTDITLDTMKLAMSGDRVQNREVELSMQSGLIVIDLDKKIDPATKSFRVTTPHGVAVARGTQWAVKVSPNMTVIMKLVGNVLVIVDTITRELGDRQKIVLPAGAVEEMTPEEVAGILALLPGDTFVGFPKPSDNDRELFELLEDVFRNIRLRPSDTTPV